MISSPVDRDLIYPAVLYMAEKLSNAPTVKIAYYENEIYPDIIHRVPSRIIAAKLWR